MEKNKEQKQIYKIIMYGDNYAGTTSLFRRYLYNEYDSNYYTYSSNFGKKEISLKNGKTITLYIWDLFYSERYRALNNIYFRGSDGVMLTYDLTNKKSLDTLQNIINDISYSLGRNVPIALIGCKSDLYEQEMFIEEGKEFARKYNLYFYELSAKENTDVDECFNDFIDKIIPKEENEKTIELNNLRRKRQPKRGCLK